MVSYLYKYTDPTAPDGYAAFGPFFCTRREAQVFAACLPPVDFRIVKFNGGSSGVNYMGAIASIPEFAKRLWKLKEKIDETP